MINIVKNHNEEPKFVKKAIQKVIEAGGVKYAHGRMIELKTEALEIIADVENNESKKALIGLVEYTVNREK